MTMALAVDSGALLTSVTAHWHWLCHSPDATPLLLGLWVRALGLVWAWACGILVAQVVYLAGERGLQPAQRKLQRMRCDLPFWRRLLRFPSIMHAAIDWKPRNFDRLMQAMLTLGAASGVATALGVVDSRWGLLLCWVVYLSMANVIWLLCYPWDYLLLECGFLSLFLPALHPLWHSVGLASTPLPLVSWSLRWLLFRLMAGFGKIKFLGASTKEFSYLKGFMINQPLPSPLGWFIHSLPLAVHQFGLFAFFVSEVIVPFGFVFADGWVRVACGLATIVLQLNIQASGNFGFFNLLSACLCLTALDGSSSLLGDMAWSQWTAAPLTHLLLGVLLPPLSLFFFIFDSWSTMSVVHWPSLNLPTTALGDFLRFLSPWHVLHAYGIFFANSMPGIRSTPVIEGTDEDVDAMDEEAEEKVRWECYTYRWGTVSPFRRPRFKAPYHHRFEQALIYDSYGLIPDTLMGVLTGGHPYEYLGENRNLVQRVCQSLLLDQEPGSPIEPLFLHNPFPSATRPVKALRISFYFYQPTSWRDWLTGKTPRVDEQGRTQYWHVKYAGSQCAGRAMTRKRLLGEVLLPENKGQLAIAPVVSHSRKAAALLGVSEDESSLARAFFRYQEPSEWHPDLILNQRMTKQYARITETMREQLSAVSAAPAGAKLDLEAILGLEQDYPSSFDPSLYTRFWTEFWPRARELHARVVESTKCAEAMQEGEVKGKEGSNQCGCSCQTCQLRNAWHVSHAQASSSAPVLNWSAEVSFLRRSLFSSSSDASSAGFTPSDLFFFRLIYCRLVMGLQDRILASDLFHKPGMDEGRTMTKEEYDEGRRKELQMEAEAHACRTACTCDGKRYGAPVDPRAHMQAPTLMDNFGLLRPVRGARAQCSLAKEHLHLPSFFHLNLFCTHALLSCPTPAAASALLVRPSSVLPLASSFSVSSGLLLLGLFHRDLLEYHARKQRVARVMSFPQQAISGGILPGFLDILANFLVYQFRRHPGSRSVERAQVEPCMRLAPEHLPAEEAIRRPQRFDEWWHIDTSALPDPTVDLAAGS